MCDLLQQEEESKKAVERTLFKPSSDTFVLDGIPHIKMRWAKE